MPPVRLDRKSVAAADRLRRGGGAKTEFVAAAKRGDAILQKAISQIESEDGWVLLGEVGGQVSNLFSDFDARSYGHNKLSDLVRKTGAFEIEKGVSSQMRVRVKPASGGAKTK